MPQTSGGFEIISTLIPVLQVKRLTKIAKRPHRYLRCTERFSKISRKVLFSCLSTLFEQFFTMKFSLYFVNMNIIKNEIDIFMISETKIDNSFPISQFTMTGYSIPFRQLMGEEYFCLLEKTFLVK